MKQIQLTQNKIALINDEDFVLVSKYNWYYNSGYAKAYHNGKRIRMHRLILGARKGQVVDHRNKIGTDNQRSNIRLCTVKENNRNTTLRKDNTSGYKGVSLDKTTGHWKPIVYVNGKPKTVGQFKDKHHAALAYDMWTIFFHKEFASTNFSVVSTNDFDSE